MGKSVFPLGRKNIAAGHESDDIAGPESKRLARFFEPALPPP
jgi:hypothetical protein